jgi:hypothetical protein
MLYKGDYFSFLSKKKNNKQLLPMKHHSNSKAGFKKKRYDTKRIIQLEIAA